MTKPRFNPKHTELASACALLLNELMSAGLYQTAQKMHDVVRSVGYEIAELREAETEPEQVTK